ncbi:hypothetical protein, partial [Escherichia coli]|uniref:hypothetical protein n=1 Tax=Escherichia coli TaxID=562 RepID=UPI00208DCA89
MMSLWDALRMNMMISYQELVRTFPKSEANIDRFCELTQSWLPMEKTEKDPVSGVWTVRNSGK